VARLALNIVDVARSNEGTFVVARRVVATTSVLDELVRLMRPLAEARDQRLVTQCDTTACTIFADRDVLLPVLVNLVANAVSPNAPRTAVTVGARADGDDVILSVCDEGPGVPGEERERVFDKYVRLGHEDVPQNGRGLGLTFCRLAVAAHGGRIWVEDR